jgi:hypothetical protein
MRDWEEYILNFILDISTVMLYTHNKVIKTSEYSMKQVEIFLNCINDKVENLRIFYIFLESNVGSNKKLLI